MSTPVINNVGILYHPMKDATRRYAEQIHLFLNGRGTTNWVASAWDMSDAAENLSHAQLLLSIGGDGTILRAAQAALPHNIPIIGINMGKLGFMTELTTDDAMEKLPGLLAGNGWLDERAMLEVEIESGATPPLAQPRFYALNDAVMARGNVVRTITVDAEIDGEHFTTYKCDGLILATATGSTSYALAAGGPVLNPQCRDFLIQPIVPHVSVPYAVVLNPSNVVRLRLATFQPALLSIDGHTNIELTADVSVKIRHSDKTIRFLRVNTGKSFYTYLMERLGGRR